MDVKELRMGNYFYDDEGHLSICTGFAPFDDSTRCDEREGCMICLDLLKDGEWHKNKECESTKCKPIKLTSDILHRFISTPLFTSDLREYHSGNRYVIGDIVLYQQDKDIDYFEVFIGVKKVRIEYFHQLQNLLFAATGLEIEFYLNSVKN